VVNVQLEAQWQALIAACKDVALEEFVPPTSIQHAIVHELLATARMAEFLAAMGPSSVHTAPTTWHGICFEKPTYCRVVQVSG